MTTQNPSPDDLGPSASQVYEILDHALKGSELNLERMLAPDLEASIEDQMRFFTRLLAGLNGAVIQTARAVDTLRDGMEELWERLNRLEGDQ